MDNIRKGQNHEDMLHRDHIACRHAVIAAQRIFADEAVQSDLPTDVAQAAEAVIFVRIPNKPDGKPGIYYEPFMDHFGKSAHVPVVQIVKLSPPTPDGKLTVLHGGFLQRGGTRNLLRWSQNPVRWAEDSRRWMRSLGNECRWWRAAAGHNGYGRCLLAVLPARWTYRVLVHAAMWR